MNNLPAIAYGDGTQLCYSYASDINGTSWTTIVPSVFNARNVSLIVLASGIPAIVFTANASTVYYIRADDVTGTQWTGSVKTVGTSPSNYISACVVNSLPAVAYRASGGDLMFAQAASETGASWTATDTGQSIDSSSGPSMCVINGVPAIAYITGSALKYVYATNADGTGWSAGISVSLDISDYISLAVINNYPAITYKNTLTNTIKYAVSSNVQGSSGWTTSVLATILSSGTFTSLCENNGIAAIAYAQSNSYTYFTTVSNIDVDWIAIGN